MLRRDHIMKLIQQLTDSLFLQLNEKETDETKRQEKFEKLYKEFLGESAAFYINAPLDEILNHLNVQYGSEELLYRVEMLSDILYNEGLLYRRSEEKATIFRKGLEILIYLDNHSDTYSLARQGKIETIKDDLSLSV